MYLADSPNFDLDDFFSLSLTDEQGNENLGTVDSPKGESFGLSTVPKLDSNADHSTLPEIIKQYSWINKEAEEKLNELINSDPIPNASVSDAELVSNYSDSLNERTKSVYDPSQKKDISCITIYNGGSYIEGKRHKTDERTKSKAKASHKSKIDGKFADGRTGRHIKEFSKKAQRNMRNALDKINLKKLEGSNRPLFVTLTIADDIQGEGMAEKCKSALQRFKKKLTRHPTYKELCGMWKLEFQRNEKPHYHIVMWGVPFVCHEWLAQTWYESLYPNPEIRKKNEKHLGSGSSIGPIHGISKREFKEGQNEVKNAKWKRVGGKNGAFKRATNYLTKYLTKESTDIPSDWKNSRFYGYINIKKFNSYKEQIDILDDSEDCEQFEAISKATTVSLNNKKRHRVNLSNKLKYLLKNEGEKVPVTHQLDNDGFEELVDEFGVPLPKDAFSLDARRFLYNEGQIKVGYDNYTKVVSDDFLLTDDEDGIVEFPLKDSAYVTQLIPKVYTTELIKDAYGKETWVDTYFGVLTEKRELKPDAYKAFGFGSEERIIPNCKYAFGVNYNSKFVLTNNNGEIVEEYEEFKDFEGLTLACESRAYNKWSSYGVDIKEIFEIAFPDSVFELRGSYITSLDKNNNPMEVKLECKLVIHEQKEMRLEKAS